AVWIDANWQFNNGGGNIGPCNGGTIGPLDASGSCNPPFNGSVSGTYDVSTPNTAYWNNVDATLRLAQQNGMYVVFNIYDSYAPWFTHGTSPNSPAALQAYGN